MMKKLKGNVISAPIAIIALVIIIIVGVYLVLTIKQANQVEKPISSTTNPTTSLATTTPVTDETTEGQTYTNKRYDFSFQYPAKWKVSTKDYSDTTEVSFTDETNHSNESDLYFKIETATEAKDINTYKTRYFPNFDEKYFQTISIDGEAGLKVTTGTPNRDQISSVVFYRNNIQYRLNMRPNSPQENFNVFDQILASFKFTD